MSKITKIALATALLSTAAGSYAENFSFNTEVKDKSDTLVVFHAKDNKFKSFKEFDATASAF